jgi:hypothetical protein
MLVAGSVADKRLGNVGLLCNWWLTWVVLVVGGCW